MSDQNEPTSPTQTPVNPQVPQDPVAQELPSAQTAILQSLANNLFCDAALQSMALVVLGEALTSDEELAAEDTWYWHDFGTPGEHSWRDYQLDSVHVGHIEPSALIDNLDVVVDTVQAKIRGLVKQYPQQIVAGTVRLCIAFATAQTEEGQVTKLNLWLAWTRYTKED